MKKRTSAPSPVAAIPPLVVVGSMGLDTIETPRGGRRDELLGGSAAYACAAASFFVPRPALVGVVGTDFSPRHRRVLNGFGLDLAGLQVTPGRTFRWHGVYEEDMNRRRTLKTELNVFADFQPELPDAYRRTPFLFLANIAPALQLHVLEQMKKRPRFVLADTMDLWIRMAADDLRRVIAAVDMLTLNESEARLLTGADTLPAAARLLLRQGPRHILIKKGEHGSMLFSADGIFLLHAHPVEAVCDPTGAGDSFAGGFIGALAAGRKITERHLRRAMGWGSVVASFNVEAFGLDRLRRLSRADLDRRHRAFKAMCRMP